MSKNFKSSVVTITGGTGSFGSTMVTDLLKQDVSEVRILAAMKTNKMLCEIQ
jgi:FlaA1/EpsC-like NDP-sugar epimerase